MFICSVIAFALCVVQTPVIIALCKKHKWYDEVDPRKVHDGHIPRLGGIGIFTSFVISAFIYSRFFAAANFSYFHPALFGGLIIFIFGVIDDFLNLRARLKFLIQIIAAFVVVCSPLYFKSFFGISFNPFFGRALTFVWILFLVNAYNLIDGLDLLCGGLSFLTLAVAGVTMLVLKQAAGNLFLILCASIFGFLLFNKPKAKIFLGDGGSQTLGFSIAMIPIVPLPGGFEHIKLLYALLLVSIPVTDVIAAVIRRGREHRSFFSADRGHIHHKLVNIGLSKTAAVVLLLCSQFLIGISAFASTLMSRTKDSIILLCVSIFLVWCFFIMLHYINRAVNLKQAGHLSEAPQEEH